MSWPAWSRNNPKNLARYADMKQAAAAMPPGFFGRGGDGMPSVYELLHGGKFEDAAEFLYRKLVALNIAYDFEPLRLEDPNNTKQDIRTPSEILKGRGTCLDLALLFAALCLNVRLLPMVVLLGGDGAGSDHALVAVDLKCSADEWEKPRGRTAAFLKEGIIVDKQAKDFILQQLETKRWLAVEIIAVAIDPPTSFADACRKGQERIEQRDHVATLDIAALQAKGETPYESLEKKLVESFAVSNIPIRVPEHFMGRKDALAEIEETVKRFSGRVTVTVLHGLRGIGKTTLAAAYAHGHRRSYRATWWIRAQTDTTTRADLVALGIRLGWVAADAKEEQAFDAVMDRLRNEDEGVLLIFDNAIDADTLKPYLPPGGAARVLVTSNAHAWRGVAEPVEIREWPKEIGADYLIERTKLRGERTSAENLSVALGGLPLAHEQAAAYCDHLGIRLADYLRSFESAKLKFLDDRDYAPAEYHGRLTVAGTFSLGIDEAAKRHQAAEPLIVHAALLAPDPVPLFLFSEAREVFGEPFASALAGDGLDKAVAALRTFALTDREPIVDDRDPSIATHAIRLHRLVREVAAARRAPEVQDQLRRALVAALATVFPTDGYRNPASWSRCALLTPHLIAVCETEIPDVAGNAERATLLESAGVYFHGRSALATARPLLERALAIREKVLGPEHPRTAESLGNLAHLLQAQDDLAGARLLLKRALAIRKKVFGPECPKTAQSLNNLANLLYAQRKFALARPLYERALAIRKKALNPEHPSTATSLHNLGRLLHAQRKFAEAQPLLKRALEIREKVLGPKQRYTALSRNSFARLLHDQDKLAEARPLYELALATCNEVLGPEHPETVTVRSNLAELLSRESTVAANEASPR